MVDAKPQTAEMTFLAIPRRKPLAETMGWWQPTYPCEYVIPQLCPHWFCKCQKEALQACYDAGGDGHIVTIDILRKHPWRFSGLRWLKMYGLVETLQVWSVAGEVCGHVYTCTDLGRTVAELVAINKGSA